MGRIGNRILTFFKKSTIAKIALAVFAVCVILIKIIPSICHTFYSGVMANLITLIFQISFTLAVIIAVLVFAKMAIYKKRTDGRNLIVDQRLYGRDQIDLMHHFARDPRKMDISKMPARPWTMCEGIIFGKAEGRTICRSSSADGNIILFAAPGVGKTVGQVIPSALSFRGSVFAVDIKGDVSNYTAKRRRIKFFDPDDVNSCHFDPLATVRAADPTMMGLAIEKIANILIPQKSQGDGAFFEKGARNIFCGITNFCITKKPNVSFSKIINAILLKDIDYWLNTINSSDIFSAKKYTADLLGTNQKNISGCYSHMVTMLRPLTIGNLPALLTPSDDMIAPSDLESGTDVYLKIKQENLSVYSPIISLIVDSAFFSYFKTRPDVSDGRRMRPILFLIDEASTALKFLSEESLTESLVTLRSKKITSFLVFQSRASLIKRYGVHGATTIMDACRYISIMSATDPESQRYFAEMIGKKMTLKSSGMSSVESEEYIIRPESLSNLGNQVIILSDGRYCIAEKIKCYEDVNPVTPKN